MSKLTPVINSKYFTLAELCKSNTADRRGIPNIPTDASLVNLQALTTNVLDPIRIFAGVTNTNSGYRCPKLNRWIPGSSKSSDHCKGKAADISFIDNSIANRVKIVNFILENIVFDKMIIEYWKGDGCWIHISYNKDASKNRGLLYTKVYDVKRYTLINKKIFNLTYKA